MPKKDYYQILEVSKDASPEEIKKSYRSLALKFHPDRNKDPNATDKFKEIGEAYAVLSDESKRRIYNMTGGECDEMGDSEFFGMGEDVDPFMVFNSIFQHHLNSFMNVNYEKEVDLNGLLSAMGGHSGIPFGSSLPGVKIQVHTFPMGGFVHTNDVAFRQGHSPMSVHSFKMNGGNDIREEYDLDSDDEGEVPQLFKHLFGRMEKEKKGKKKKVIKEKVIRERPDDIQITVKVTLKDILKNEKKTITYERMRKKNGEYKMRKRKIDIPIYGKEILFNGDGNEEPDCKEKGHVIIYIEMKKEPNYKRIHEYHLFTFIKIHPDDLDKTIPFKMPDDDSFMIDISNLGEDRICKIIHKGLHTEEEERGDLYIYFDVTKHASRISDEKYDQICKIQICHITEVFDD
jgi:DnaJ-class molecular chaperone